MDKMREGGRIEGTDTLTEGTVGEWSLRSDRDYDNPFADLDVTAHAQGPDGGTIRAPLYYDGDGTWRLRFNPRQAGAWTISVAAMPADEQLAGELELTVVEGDQRGFLRATPDKAWGFCYDSGQPVFILGDTVYNLFGMAHCGGDVAGFLRRRTAQGFNLLRVRLPVSPFHPPQGHSDWQTRRTWPWGGSEQKPLFDRFNLDYFATVDEVIAHAESLGIGLEVIMEAWGFEWPFGHREAFVPEWERLWMRYLLARYDAYNCVWFWTLMNEYEYYPDGDWRYNPLADRWALHMARWVKATAAHDHVVSIHNGPRRPPFARRFARDLEAIDAVMYQTWGSRDEEYGWLADGIEEDIRASLADWSGAAVFAEWGYERNPELDMRIPSHTYCGPEHTRRGAWRGAFCGLGIIHGFENSWGPWMHLEEDQVGLDYLLLVKRFFTEIAPFEQLRPASDLVIAPESGFDPGAAPLALASDDRDLVAVYLPVGGDVALRLESASRYKARWYDSCTGKLTPASPADRAADGVAYAASQGQVRGRPKDWVLLLRCESR